MQETIDAIELAKRWGVPVSWVRNYTRIGYTRDPIPHLQLCPLRVGKPSS